MEPRGHDVDTRRGRKGCPPHGPHLVYALEKGSYVARCLACGLTGPERKDGMEAKQAFDETAKIGRPPDLVHRRA